jgi:hypothetical protein
VEASGFSSGREFAAWLGLVPRQHSTGGKARLGGISTGAVVGEFVAATRGLCYLLSFAQSTYNSALMFALDC